MDIQKLLSLVRQAVERYRMIEEGDRIAVGVSGGKDSMALLYALKKLSAFYPKSFELRGICVDLGHPGTDFSALQRFCEELGVELSVVATQIEQIVFGVRKEKHPCSLCAKLRKGALVTEAQRLGCNKIAYAHHRDDFVETMLLSLLFQGRFYAFPPVTRFEDRDMEVIRPLMLVEESRIRGFVRKYEIPTIENPCPADGRTERAYVKTLLAQIEREHPGTKKRMFRAITEGGIEDWPCNPDAPFDQER
ncbi:MAG: tRNA 2-thiocytidine(32) synthetase TtcA [Lachnospiraceae bacterium]|nr:tRNA 2-thiocytidine(32) synthetase TtcA [Lachnospiraceae bacterium]